MKAGESTVIVGGTERRACDDWPFLQFFLPSLTNAFPRYQERTWVVGKRTSSVRKMCFQRSFSRLAARRLSYRRRIARSVESPSLARRNMSSH